MGTLPKSLDFIKFGGSCIYCGVPNGREHEVNCPVLREQIAKSTIEEEHCVQEVFKDEKISALDEQIGGDHYKKFTIQPIEFITKNKLSFIQGCVIKRICRYNIPGGKGKEDLEKIIHEIKCLIEIE